VPLAGSRPRRSAVVSVHVPSRYYGTTTLVAPSAAEARCSYRVHDPSTVERELPVSFDLTKRQDEGLFPHAECALHGEVRMADDENPVQWAVATCKRDEGTVMVVFRGSDNPLDIVTSSVDACMFIKDLGLRANSRLWGALHSSEHGASESIIRALTSDAELKDRAVVVCGHSLGGAYATLFALELLKRGVAVRSVASFGGPQVVVPKPDNELWRSLNEVATVYVNEFDAIPRLPSCERWVFDAVPSIAHVSAEQAAYLREKWSSLEKYRHIGRLLFIGDGRDHAMRVHEAASNEQSTAPHMAPQPLLLAATAADLQVRGAKPGMLVAHHFDYSAVTAQLTVSEAGNEGGEAVARLSEGAWMATATVAEKELAILFDTMENWKEGQAQLLQQQLKMIKGIQEDQAQLLQQQQAQAARISEMEAELGELRLSVHGELGKCVTTEEVTAMLDAKTHEVSIPVGSR
jgi:pimeloyl-ACP methyl ester carboxylesterase